MDSASMCDELKESIQRSSSPEQRVPADQNEVLKNPWVESLQVFENNDDGGTLWLIFVSRATFLTGRVGFLSLKKHNTFMSVTMRDSPVPYNTSGSLTHLGFVFVPLTEGSEGAVCPLSAGLGTARLLSLILLLIHRHCCAH